MAATRGKRKMLIVRIELHSAKTGKITEIARAEIVNDGAGSASHGNYRAKTVKGAGPRMSLGDIRAAKALREAGVTDYPRQHLHVWNLVARLLKAMGYY
jgi:hypothetical protein